MIAPLLVSSIPLIQFLLDRVIRREKKSSNLVLMTTAWSSIFPIFTVYMLLMDQVFILNTTVLVPVALLFKCCNIGCLNNFIDIFTTQQYHGSSLLHSLLLSVLWLLLAVPRHRYWRIWFQNHLLSRRLLSTTHFRLIRQRLLFLLLGSHLRCLRNTHHRIF